MKEQIETNITFALKAKTILSAYGDADREQIMEYFIQHNLIIADDFALWMGYPIDVAKMCMGEFLSLGGLLQHASRSEYYKTVIFTRFLKNELRLSVSDSTEELLTELSIDINNLTSQVAEVKKTFKKFVERLEKG